MPEWYDDVGMQIVDMMKINAVMPLVNVVVALVTPKVMQRLDTDTWDVYKTKATSISDFKGIYGGGEYAIEEMYSEAFNTIFITMLYGIGLPILFPLAALRLFLQWICQRVTVAYCMRLPPAMDDSLSKNAIQILMWAPIFMIFNGFWMIGNM